MNPKLRLIALSGTNGSGKDSVGDLLARDFGYKFISFSGDFRQECLRRGIEPIRENTRMISAEWRRQYGLAVMVDRAVEQYKKEGGNYTGLVIANVRNPFEADRVRELGGTNLWVDADPIIRYARTQAVNRDRADDQRTFKQFMAEELAEMHAPPGGDSATLDMAAVKTRADIIFFNNSGDLDTFKQELMATLGLGS